ncbi:class I SAM-dependent methyltransferase [Nocardiopsis sp. EMB25]|uniref:class I SAM-dependent methyltransferase n=1 Tax=Nocardiopsis sp. EMB25 TaxID=2835867 RepID=UPI002283B630|nr:class I SAM-dependent methyltransferase [Nocardiopsis sp. EMB25]MCY9783965.1 class I SAM-dependent methyltransferase [Nocardiopsis sp. EMB25]
MGDDRFRHPFFARFYTWVAGAMDDAGLVDHRRALVSGLHGQVLEVGAGHGPNFPHYPRTVDHLTAVEPEPHLRRTARARITAAPVPVTVVDGRAERLPFEAARFDAAVVALVLCSVADQGTALREIHRVLVPGGRLRFLEHVRADTARMCRTQRWIDATLGPRLLGGCHCGRDTLTAIERAGFTLTVLDAFLFPEARTPHSFHVRGEATRP